MNENEVDAAYLADKYRNEMAPAEKKRVVAMQKKILRRKEKDQHSIEIFDNIEELLRSSQEDETSEPMVVTSSSTIPDSVPCYSMLDSSLFGHIFTEDGFELKDFVSPDYFLFGSAAAVMPSSLFRKIITTRAYNLRSEPLDAGVSLYVLHLMGSTTCPLLARCCLEFLARNPVDVTANTMLYILLNLGVAETNWSGATQVPQCVTSRQKGRDDFPHTNVEMLLKFLTHSVLNRRFVCNADAQPIVTLLSKLGLDRRIRSGPLLAIVVQALSLLAARCTEAVGPELVADWLFAPHDHPLNILEVCRLLVWSKPPLQRQLLLGAVRRLLGTEPADKMGPGTEVTPRDARVIIRALPTQNSLITYTAIHLLIYIVPDVQLSKKEFEYLQQEINKLPVSGDMSDEVRLRAAAARFRSTLKLLATKQLLGDLGPAS